MSGWFSWTPLAALVVGLLTTSCTAQGTRPASDSASTGGSAGEAATSGSEAGGSSAGGLGVGGSAAGGGAAAGSSAGGSGSGGGSENGGAGGVTGGASGAGTGGDTTIGGAAGSPDGGAAGTGGSSTSSTGGAAGCDEGAVWCDGQCIDPATDPVHCGASGDCQGDYAGTQCGPAQSCREGFCSSWEAPVALQPKTGPTCRWLDLAMNHDGFAVLAWYESLDRGQNVWASLYAPQTGWTDTEPLEAAYGEPDASGPPSVALDPDGTAMVVWDSFDDEGLPSLWSARHEAGSSWEAGELVDPADDELPDTSRSCQVALAPAGDAIVVCAVYSTGVYSNRYTEAQGWGIPELVSTNYHGVLRLATNPSGTAIASWEYSYSIDDFSYDQIRGALFDAASGSPTGWGWTTSDRSWRPDAAIDPPGNLLVVWGDEWSGQVMARRAAVGAGFDSEAEVGWIEPFDAPRVGVDGNGNAIVAWYWDEGVWANRYSVESGWAAPEAIGKYQQAWPGEDELLYTLKLAVGSAGDAVVVWPQMPQVERNWGEKSDIQLWSNRYTPDQGWGTPELIDVAIAGNTLSFDVAIDGQGNAIVAWSPEEYPAYDLLVSRSGRPE